MLSEHEESIQNDIPIIGQYNVNSEGSGDMYYKGANLLHTIRTLINDDEKWRQILRGLNKDFYHKTVTTQQVENYIIDNSGLDLTTIFDQYLRTVKIPVFEYKIENGKLSYRWNNVIKDFNMPINIIVDGKMQQQKPTASWQTKKIDSDSIKVDVNFYVKTIKTN